MNRSQAMTLLKELIESKLVEPSWISFECKAEVYKLKIKAVQKSQQIEQFFAKNNLILEEENGYWLISKI